MMGTLRYMSPEQASGRAGSLNRSSDVYSLGATLYELMTLSPPFTADHQAEMLAKLLHEEPRPPRKLVGTIPSDLETIALKAMSKSQEERYQDAQCVADDLNRFIVDRPILAKPPTCQQRLMKWTRRNRKLVVGGIAGSVIIALVGLLGLLFALREIDSKRIIAEQALERESIARSKADELLEAEKRAVERLRLSNYYQSIASAEFAYHSNNIQAADATLSTCDSELRGWEWFYLDTVCNSAFRTFHASSGAVHAVAFSPESKRIAVASSNIVENFSPRLALPIIPPSLEIIDIESSVSVKIKIDELQIRDLHFSSDGKTLYGSCGQWQLPGSGVFVAWNVADRSEVWRYQENLNVVWKFDVSLDSRYLALASNNAIRILDAETHALVQKLECGAEAYSVSFCPQGDRVAVGLKDTICIFDLASGKRIQKFHRLPGKEFRCLDWNPESTQIAAGAFTGEAFLLEPLTGRVQMLQDSDHSAMSRVRRISYDALGSRVAFSSNSGAVHVWNQGESLHTIKLRGHSHEVSALAFDNSNQLMATGSWDGTVRIWGTDSMIQGFDNSAAKIQSAVTTEDGRYLVTAGFRPSSFAKSTSLSLWDLKSRKFIKSIVERKGGFTSLAIGPKDLLAHDWGPNIRLLKRIGDKWRQWCELEGGNGPVTSLAISPQNGG